MMVARHSEHTMCVGFVCRMLHRTRVCIAQVCVGLTTTEWVTPLVVCMHHGCNCYVGWGGWLGRMVWFCMVWSGLVHVGPWGTTGIHGKPQTVPSQRFWRQELKVKQKAGNGRPQGTTGNTLDHGGPRGGDTGDHGGPQRPFPSHRCWPRSGT